MIDAKEAELGIGEALNNDSITVTREERIAYATLNALRGIMGELYRMRKLGEVGIRLLEWDGETNFKKLYAEDENE